MTTPVFVSSAGSNTSPYETWAKAATSFQTGLTQASTAGDKVIIQYDAVPSGDAELAADTTYTAAASIDIISASNDGGTAYTPTAMGTSYWIGNSTASRSIAITPTADTKLYIYGITWRISGTSDNINMSGGTSMNWVFRDVYFWYGTTGATGYVNFGSNSSNTRTVYTFIGCTFRWGAVGHRIVAGLQRLNFIGCNMVSAAGTVPTTLFHTMSSGGVRTFDGCDFSAGTLTLVGDISTGYNLFTLSNCKLPATFTALAAQTSNTQYCQVDVWMYNCASGDTHYHIAHHNVLGSTVVDTGIYANDNIADTGLSWKIVTSAYATPECPYETPWMEVYHSATSAITPYLECVRSGSATAYYNDEVWSRWAYQGTSGSPLAVINESDRAVSYAVRAAQTDSSKGASDWTGENATSWFGKLAPTAAFTPAEAGPLRAKVCVGAASATVYVDAQIRGRA